MAAFPLSVKYCTICTLPHEYCEWGPSPNNCKKKLFEDDHQLYESIYGTMTEEITQKTNELSMQEDEKLAKKKEANQKKNKGAKKVVIKRVERNKKKFITVVAGLEAFDVDLKKAAKRFANKFACGSSVTKNASNQEEIVVQGDVIDELVEFIKKEFSQLKDDDFEIVLKEK